MIVQFVKNLHAVQETLVQFLGWEDPLEKEMATHSSILAWRIPRMEESGGLQSTGSQSRTRLSDFIFFFFSLTVVHQASLSIINSQGLLKLRSTEVGDEIQVSSCLQSFPASGSFQMSQFFELGGQSIGVSASASVLPKKIQDQFPLGFTGWISLLSKGVSRVFSNTTVQKHQFFGSQLSL